MYDAAQLIREVRLAVEARFLTHEEGRRILGLYGVLRSS